MSSMVQMHWLGQGKEKTLNPFFSFRPFFHFLSPKTPWPTKFGKPPTTTTSCGATASRPIRSIPTRPSISSWPPTPGSTSPSLLITMPCNSEATWAITPSPGPKRTHYGQMTMHTLDFTRTMHWLVSWYGWKKLLQSINQSDAVHIYIYLIFVYVCKRIFIYIYIIIVFCWAIT